MDNFCTKCGNKLDGKMKCDKCGVVSKNITMSDIASKVKNYDYKSKAEALKTKAEDLADKAKQYDYKGKAEELKTKADDIATKAKQYDYKGEAENIKKGGLRYFWNKHKKLSLAAMALVVIAIVAVPFIKNNDEYEDDTDSHIVTTEDTYETETKIDDNTIIKNNDIVKDNHFCLTVSEFVEKYNSAFKQLYPEDVFGNSILEDSRCVLRTPADSDKAIGASKLYVFDQTLYRADDWNRRQDSALLVYTDQDDNCIY